MVFLKRAQPNVHKAVITLKELQEQRQLSQRYANEEAKKYTVIINKILNTLTEKGML